MRWLLVTDDKILAHVAAQTQGIEAVHSQAVLVYLLARGSITESEYADAVLRLVEDGYTFVRVSEDHFFLLLDQEDFQITSAVSNLFKIFDSPTTEFKSAASVAAGLLRRLFMETIPTDVREPIGRRILDGLAKHHPKQEVRDSVLAFLEPSMPTLAPVQARRLTQFLSKW